MRAIHKVAAALFAVATATGCPATEGDDGGSDDGGSDDGGSDDGGSDDGGGDDGPWREVALPERTDDGIFRADEDRITGFHCTTASKCVVSTDNFDGGALFAATPAGVTATLMVSTQVEADGGTLGDQTFHGFDQTAMGLIARLSSGTQIAYASGDPNLVASWKISRPGTNEGEGFGITPQLTIRSNAAGNRWMLWNKYGSYEGTAAPSRTTVWTGLWSPGQMPTVPADLAARRRVDPTICDSEAGNRTQPSIVDAFYISPDLQTVIYPAASQSARSNDAPGACVSTDGGHLFHQAPLPAEAGEIGPAAIHCRDADHCVAINALPNYDDSYWIYSTSNASAGADLTWAKATVPALAGNQRKLNAAFFAPDGQHGFVVGHNNGKALLLVSSDGGLTWENRSTPLVALNVGELYAGQAFDDGTLWLGGVNGALLVSSTAGK